MTDQLPFFGFGGKMWAEAVGQTGIWKTKCPLLPEFGRMVIRAVDTEIRRRDELASSLFAAISHGSEEHRVWLKKAIDDHFAGRPVEAPRG